MKVIELRPPSIVLTAIGACKTDDGILLFRNNNVLRGVWGAEPIAPYTGSLGKDSPVKILIAKDPAIRISPARRM